MIELQKKIFETKMSRRELINYIPSCKPTFHIQVFRNHSFELVEHTIGLFLDYADIGVEFAYSGYDDSLSFTELNPSADLILLWIDAARYTSNVNDFLGERLHALRLKYNGPVLLVPLGTVFLIDLPGVVVFNLGDIANRLGESYLDERAESITGTRLSAKAMMEISRSIGLQYLPSMLRPSLKAIVVDLDNTLYKGVLGEDGLKNVQLTEGHRILQKKLKEFADNGFFLCCASKNEIEDVKQLFENRKDFPLTLSDFSIIKASWDSKADMVAEIAQFLNINPDSMVFVDDNIGELTTVQTVFPQIKVILATEGDKTEHVLDEFPGLMKLQHSQDDQKRKLDIQAKQERELIRKELSPEEYIRSLDLSLTFERDNPDRVVRIFELANKTNQFIFNYKRYTQQEVVDRNNSSEYAIINVSLKDRLSDSGLIGVCVGHAIGDYVEIEEFFVSCRALGRGVDEMIVLGAISYAAKCLDRDRVKVLFQIGPRNTPAKQFVDKALVDYLDAPKEFSYVIPAGLMEVNHIDYSNK